MQYPPLLVSALVVLACGKGSPEEGPCRKDAEALGRLLAEANVDPPLFYVGDLKLVERSDLGPAKTARAPELMIRAGEIRLEGRPVAREELVARLAEARKRVDDERERGRSDGAVPGRIYLLIEGAAPWGEVVGAVEAADLAGFQAPAFVFTTTVVGHPPPRSSIDDELDALLKEDSGERATRFAKIVSKQVETCPALTTEFGRVSSVEGEDKATTLIKAIPEALVECKCHVNMPALRSAMWRLLWNPTPTRVIAFEPAAPAMTLSLPAATTWAVASKQLTPATKRAAFVSLP